MCVLLNSAAVNVVLEDSSFPEEHFAIEQGLLTTTWDRIQSYPSPHSPLSPLSPSPSSSPSPHSLSLSLTLPSSPLPLPLSLLPAFTLSLSSPLSLLQSVISLSLCLSCFSLSLFVWLVMFTSFPVSETQTVENLPFHLRPHTICTVKNTPMGYQCCCVEMLMCCPAICYKALTSHNL